MSGHERNAAGDFAGAQRCFLEAYAAYLPSASSSCTSSTTACVCTTTTRWAGTRWAGPTS